MSRGVSATPPPSSSSSVYYRIPSKTHQSHRRRCCNPSCSSSAVTPRASRDHPPLSSSYLKLKPTGFAPGLFPRIGLRCNSSTGPGGPGPGRSDIRGILDAFFLGKALAEALNERIESTVGEFLSTIGRLQAEQQKQVQDFQEDVLERAKRAKEKAAREAMEAQGPIPKSSTAKISTVADGFTSTTAPLAPDAVPPPIPPSPSDSSAPTADIDQKPTNMDPLLGVSNDD